jgi:hypothetical protein
MRKLTVIICSFLTAFVMVSPAVVSADDQTGKWGIGGFGGAAIPLGSKFIKDNGETNVGVGGHLRYGMSRHWSVMLAYDNMYFKKNIRVEDITASALYHLCPDSRFNPFLRFGWGVASGQGAKNFNDLAGIAGLGAEFFALPFFSLGPVVTYHYDSKTGDSLNETHAVTAGLMGTFSFGGGEPKPAPVKQAKAAPVDSDGDGVADIRISELLAFHKKQGKLATVTATRPPGRFGAMRLKGGEVTGFEEKPMGDGGYINGGFFVLSPKVLDYVDSDKTIWEQEPMRKLVKEGQLAAFAHDSFWQPMDTIREKQLLEGLWTSGKAPWKVWS